MDALHIDSICTGLLRRRRRAAAADVWCVFIHLFSLLPPPTDGSIVGSLPTHPPLILPPPPPNPTLSPSLDAARLFTSFFYSHYLCVASYNFLGRCPIPHALLKRPWMAASPGRYRGIQRRPRLAPSFLLFPFSDRISLKHRPLPPSFLGVRLPIAVGLFFFSSPISR